MTGAKRWWRPRSLRGQLVIWVSVIVSLAVLGVGAVGMVSLRDEMVSLADGQVANSLTAFSHSYRTSAVGPEGIPPGGWTGAFRGQSSGSVIAMLDNGIPAFVLVSTDGELAPASSDVAQDLESVNWRAGDRQTVSLGSLGQHRVGSALIGDRRLVSAVPLAAANKTVARSSLVVAVLMVIALVAAGSATVLVVRRTLEPLRRVAGVAARVATMPLDDPDHRITDRVAEPDTHPESEVGVVGQTLNRLLVNVDNALTRMAESDRHMRQFLTDASHELRTPLASILGYAELTRQESDQLPPMTEYALTRIEAESQRMSNLVSDLLLLSRLDEGQDLQLEEIDLRDLVADALNDIAVTAPDHRFVAELPHQALLVWGDRARLQQLVANLLANARVHTPEGVTVTTSLSAASEKGRPVVELVVSDNGPGIPEAIMPRLFDRFVRADKARSREMGSTGLGLAIVASIVEAHRGTVRAESRPGRTAFTVRLPGSQGRTR
ncbi:MAG: HAMP domain-containing histidine kinase [Mycobacterium sp.]|nr:HAMP domain-containing histidine kinase [Mycobacterium sp.]